MDDHHGTFPLSIFDGLFNLEKLTLWLAPLKAFPSLLLNAHEYGIIVCCLPVPCADNSKRLMFCVALTQNPGGQKNLRAGVDTIIMNDETVSNVALQYTPFGKRVVITGGSKGIGRACVQEFAALQCRILTCARNQADLDLLLEESKAKGWSVEVVGGCIDPTEPELNQGTVVFCFIERVQQIQCSF